MPFEIREILQLHVSTTRKPKYEIYSLSGVAFSITAATWTLEYLSTKEEVGSGTCAVDNSDTDAAGNTIRTIQPTMVIGATDIPGVGAYRLLFNVSFSTGETDRFKASVEMLDYSE
jgi:hypothetical protein